MYKYFNYTLFFIFILLFVSSTGFSQEGTLEPKSNFGRQFKEDPGKYDYQRTRKYNDQRGYGDYYDPYYRPNTRRYYNNRILTPTPKNNNSSNQPVYYWDEKGYHVKWPTTDKREKSN